MLGRAFDSQLSQEVVSPTDPPDRYWGPPSLLFDVYQGISFPPGVSSRGVMLIVNLCLVSTLIMDGALPLLPPV